MKEEAKTENGVRQFSTGATRSAEGDKYDYEGFLSPLAIERFGQYMHSHRRQPDGTLRDSDNWQKGIPIPQYMKSGWRHLVSAWTHFRLRWNTPQGLGPAIEDDLCALIFNAQGMLHEILKAKTKAVTNESAPITVSGENGEPVFCHYPTSLPEINMFGPLLYRAGFQLTGEFRSPVGVEWFVSAPNLVPLESDPVSLFPPRWILKKIK
jgi:hypothetical protein